MSLVLKSKKHKGYFMWAAFAEGFTPNVDHPVVVSAARDEAAAEKEFSAYAAAFEASNESSAAGVNAVLALRMGG